MKIRAIRYQNFRNFEKKGEILFDTSGKVTVIYGTNGVGKTTLHQLFRWILYDKVSFNKTTSETKLYNLEKGSKLGLESSIMVWGEVEFEHNGDIYCARREYEYYKQSNGNIIRKKDSDFFNVQKKYDSNDWRDVKYPDILIESVLPYGLSPYFFFDGETMIADLKIRGTDSAKILRKALYTIFDLEAYEKAIDDLGSTTRSQSVIGQLETKRLKAAEDASEEAVVKQYLRDIKLISRQLEGLTEENEELTNDIEQMESRLTEISESIGSNRSKQQLESARKTLVDTINDYKNSIKKEKLRFGKEIENSYAYLLISEVIKDADARLYMKVQDEEKKIIPGLTKELILSLLNKNGAGKCICGHDIDEQVIDELEKWKSYFPPASYKATYDRFKHTASRYSREYDENSLYEFLKNIVGFKKRIKEYEDKIDEIDEELKDTGDIDKLIDERKAIEESLKEKRRKLKDNNDAIAEKNRQKRIREKKTTNMQNAGGEVDRIAAQIGFVERVIAYFKLEIQNRIKEYSSTLQDCIQDLVDSMLTSKRTVALNEEFQLIVKDSYDDESKSEGQFAVVSFAYIGGILKVLKTHEKIQNKEYPLVLDGPFSKLDPVQKKNVIRVIPEYAPQVIIFSKDPLDEFFTPNMVGRVYTMVSNDEKNNTVIEEGNLWKQGLI